jgi:hypothetical protein
MKTNRYHLLSLLFILMSVAQSARSQGSIDDLIKGSQKDANYLVNGYVSPVLKVIGYGLNQGWYNTAKPHKKFGVDLTATVNLIKIPSSDLNYYVDNSKLSSIELTNSAGTAPAPNGGGLVPTVVGPNVTPLYHLKNDPATGLPAPYTSQYEFQGPSGADLSKTPVMSNALPVPVVQLGIGLPKGFDLKVRMIPKIKFGDNKDSDVSLIGFGLMHDIKQYLPGIKRLPFDLSGFVGYTNMKVNVAFDKNHQDQKGTLTSSATTIQAVISKKVSVLTGYFGLGYNIANTKVAVTGKYDTDNDGVTDTNININMNAASTGPRATVGMRLKLAVFTFHGEYTMQKYSSLTLGFGISVR